MLAEGNHKVKVVGCFTGESAEKQTPYFGIEFETLKDEVSINWLAYMTATTFVKQGKETSVAKENMKTLLELGFKGRSFSDLSNTNKSVSDLFNEVEGISISVEHEEYTKDDGEVKTSAKIKFVNVGFGPNKFDHKQAVVKFKSLGFDGELLKLQKQLGVKGKATSPENTPDTSSESESAGDSDFSADDIPF